MRSILVMVVLGLVLAGCQTTAKKQSSHWVLVPVGSTVTVNQDFELPLEQARVFFQGGKVVLKNDVDQWTDSCNLERRAISKQGDIKTIRAGSFTTGKVNRPLRGGSDQTQRYFDQRIPLESDSQPDVVALNCIYEGDPRFQFYMSITRIKQTLGSLVTLELSEDIPE